MKYQRAEQWRDDAMQRANGVHEDESELRRERVRHYLKKEGGDVDADKLADYELYILGKMEMQEYEQYLLFKHKSHLQKSQGNYSAHP